MTDARLNDWRFERVNEREIRITDPAALAPIIITLDDQALVMRTLWRLAAELAAAQPAIPSPQPARAVLESAKVALAEAELLLHKAWAEHDLRSIDDGEGVIRDVAKAADRMDAAHSQVVAHLAALAATSEPDKRAAFEAWAPSVHMRTERWTVNPELYDDEDAISAWQGFQAGATWQQAQAAIPAPEGASDLRAAAQTAAAALEKIARHFGIRRLGESTLADSNARCEAHAAMEALRAALQSKPDQEPQPLTAQGAQAPAEGDGRTLSVPFGMALVPREPTEDMLSNVDEEVGGHCHSCSKWSASWDDCRRVWTAMLAAAPTVAPLTLETAEEARKDRAHAEAYYRQAEKLLTANEATLRAERDQLLEQLAAAQREVIELRAANTQPKGTEPAYLAQADMQSAAYPADLVRIWPEHNRARYTVKLYDHPVQAPAPVPEQTPAGYNRPPSGEPCNSEDWNAGYEAGLADGKAATPGAQPKEVQDAAWRKWADAGTVGSLISFLATLDQAEPIVTAYHVTMGNGERRCKTQSLTISRERVDHTTSTIRTADTSLPYTHVLWAHPPGALQAPAVGATDGMLEPLIYAAIMHHGTPKTAAEFERAARTVAEMLERRAPGGREWHGLTTEERASFVNEICDHGTGFVAPLFSLAESLEDVLKARNSASPAASAQAAEADAKDATRYQALRGTLGVNSFTYAPRITDPTNEWLTYTPEGLDKVCDEMAAALAAKKPASHPPVQGNQT